MKLTVKLLVLALCLAVVSACSNAGNTAPLVNNNPTNATQEQTTGTNNEVIQEESEVEIVSQLTAEQQEVVSALEAALEFTKQQNIVNYTYLNNVEDYFSDGTSTSYYFNEYVDIQREPALVSLHGSRGSADYIKNGDNFETANEYYSNYVYYLSKEDGLFYSYDDDENWHNDSLPDDFKTIEHIEDLVSFFLQFPEQLSLSIEPYEGGFEELDENETMEFRRINLEFNLNQFLEHTVFLTSNFFTGNHFPDLILDSPYSIISPELNNYSVSLLLDDQNRVNEFYVSYETEDYDKSMYTEYFTSSVYFMYDKEFLPEEVFIPEEVFTNAIDATGSRGGE